MKTLAQELREEADHLSFRARNASIKGKRFSMEEAQKLCEQRGKELKALDDPATER